jgi:hypothetical protein
MGRRIVGGCHQVGSLPNYFPILDDDASKWSSRPLLNALSGQCYRLLQEFSIDVCAHYLFLLTLKVTPAGQIGADPAFLSRQWQAGPLLANLDKLKNFIHFWGKSSPVFWPFPQVLSPKAKRKRGNLSGTSFEYTISAFNRILDFSNGLDIYLGFFYFRTSPFGRLLAGGQPVPTFVPCTKLCSSDCC